MVVLDSKACELHRDVFIVSNYTNYTKWGETKMAIQDIIRLHS